MRNLHRLLLVFVLYFAGSELTAIVNPGLQPAKLASRYRLVLGTEVVAVDRAAKRFTLRITDRLTGEGQPGVFAPAQVIVDASAAAAAEGFAQIHTGMVFIAYAGKTRRGGDANALLFYVGSGKWGLGTMDPSDPATWTWTVDPDQVEDSDRGAATMWGTFSGREDRLLELVKDQAAGIDYFPAEPILSFANDLVIGKLAGPAAGMALHDLDGDGRPDIIACSIAGLKVWMQQKPGGDGPVFVDRTAELGLSGVVCISVAIADATGSGRQDLLLDGTLWLRQVDGHYVASSLLPTPEKPVLVATFADFNGDGLPDVLVSQRGGGLHLYSNGSGTFTEVTIAEGLERTAGQTGFVAVAPGDWDGSGRPALWYSAGGGQLLHQDTQGRFVQMQAELHLEGNPFNQSAGRTPGLTGGALFAPLWKQDQPSLFLPLDNDFRTAIWEHGALLDATMWANELSERTYFQSFSVAEDLDMDGYVDVYTASRAIGTPNTYHTNRGYGSFMRAEKYKRNHTEEVFNSEAHLKGAGGAAAGDADGDGYNDLLLGSLDGSVSLLLSDIAATRHPSENAPHDQAKMQQTGLVAVTVTGTRGVVGAVIRIVAADSRVVGRRDLGGNGPAGCRSPDRLCLAVREPGAYSVQVRFSDGAILNLPVTVKSLAVAEVVADRASATR